MQAVTGFNMDTCCLERDKVLLHTHEWVRALKKEVKKKQREANPIVLIGVPLNLKTTREK